MEEKFYRNDVVTTQDGRYLGDVLSLHHRQDNINPQLELYAAYLQVWNEKMGDKFFVPTDFVRGRDASTGKLMLTVDFVTVETETWTRLPDFVARGEDREEALTARETNK